MLTKYTIDSSQLPSGIIVTADIADAGVTPPKIKTKAVVALSDAAAVLSATQMIDSGIFTITPSVARILTTDTATNIVAGMSGYQVGTWFDIVIVNTAAFDVTLAAGAGVTLSGNVILHKAAGTWRARIDSASAVTFYRMSFNIEDATIATAKIIDSNITEAKISASSGSGLGLLRTARAKYSFAVDGGVVGLITPATNATIPDNAVIIGGTINSTTAVTSGGAATVSVGTSAGSSAASLLGVTAIASLSADATLNSLATFAAPVKMTAAGSVTITVAAFDLTAGIIEITVLYFVAAA